MVNFFTVFDNDSLCDQTAIIANPQTTAKTEVFCLMEMMTVFLRSPAGYFVDLSRKVMVIHPAQIP
jgi:GTP:adenosylcobinamide-phosphate guanylyltransferase